MDDKHNESDLARAIRQTDAPYLLPAQRMLAVWEAIEKIGNELRIALGDDFIALQEMREHHQAYEKKPPAEDYPF